MRFFLDTEFHEDGRTIDLISIGVVAEDGREFYACNLDADWQRINREPWLAANVLPHLPEDGAVEWMPHLTIRDRLLAFVGADPKPEFWAYYADYDWVALCQLFGRMLDLPKHFPMFCRDLKQLAVDKGSPALPKQDSNEHHALADARWNKQAHAFLSAPPKEATPMPSKAEDHRDPISGAPIPNIQIKWPDAELTTTERQAVLAAFRSISEIVDHDSRVYCIAQEQACWLASELRDASPAPALSSGEEHPIHDWIPFSKRARHETIIKAARAVVDNARDQGRDDCMDDLVDEQHVEQLRQALDALDADWPKTGPFTRPDQEKKT